MKNTNASTLIAENTGTRLQLREDDVVTTAFVLKSILVLAVLLVMAYSILRWVSTRVADINRSGRALEKNAIRVISATKASIKTRLIFVEIDGRKAVIVENQQGSALSWLPGVDNKPEFKEGEM